MNKQKPSMHSKTNDTHTRRPCKTRRIASAQLHRPYSLIGLCLAALHPPALPCRKSLARRQRSQAREWPGRVSRVQRGSVKEVEKSEDVEGSFWIFFPVKRRPQQGRLSIWYWRFLRKIDSTYLNILLGEAFHASFFCIIFHKQKKDLSVPTTSLQAFHSGLAVASKRAPRGWRCFLFLSLNPTTSDVIKWLRHLPEGLPFVFKRTNIEIFCLELKRPFVWRLLWTSSFIPDDLEPWLWLKAIAQDLPARFDGKTMLHCLRHITKSSSNSLQLADQDGSGLPRNRTKKQMDACMAMFH